MMKKVIALFLAMMLCSTAYLPLSSAQIITLNDDSPVQGSMDDDNEEDTYEFDVSTGSWQVVIATEATGDLNLDYMRLLDPDDNEKERSSDNAFSITYLGLIIDGRQADEGTYSVELRRNSGEGDYYIEMEDSSNNRIDESGSFAGTFSEGEVIEVYEFSLTEYVGVDIDLYNVQPDDADLDLYLYEPTEYSPFLALNYHESNAVKESKGNADEEISFIKEGNGYHLLLVVNKRGVGCSYEIDINFNGRELKDNEPVVDKFGIASRDDEEIFNFDLDSKDWYVITALEYTEQLNLNSLTLYDEDGNVGESSEDGSETCSYLGIIVDGRNVKQERYVLNLEYYNNNKEGEYSIELENGKNNIIHNSGEYQGTFDEFEVIEIYDFSPEHTIIGISIELQVPEGADLDLLLFKQSSSNPFGYFNEKESTAVSESRSDEEGGVERVVYTGIIEQYEHYCIVIVNRHGKEYTYTMKLEINGAEITDEPSQGELSKELPNALYNFIVNPTSWYVVAALSDEINFGSLTMYDSNGVKQVESIDNSKTHPYIGVAVDGRNVSNAGIHVLDLARHSGSGSFYIEVEEGNKNVIDGNGTYDGEFSQGEVLKVFEIRLAKAHAINLLLEVKESDLDLFLFEPNETKPYRWFNWYGSNSGDYAIDKSAGFNEELSFHVKNKGVFCIAVVNKEPEGYHQFSLTVRIDGYELDDESRMSGKLSLKDGEGKVVYDSNDVYYFKVDSKAWYVIASTNDTEDLNLRAMILYNNENDETIRADDRENSVTYLGVAVNGRAVENGIYSIDLLNYEGSGVYYIELEEGEDNILLSDGVRHDKFSEGEVIEVYEIKMDTGDIVNFTLDMNYTSDLDLFIFSPSESYWRFDFHGGGANSMQDGYGEVERISYRAVESGYQCVVVVCKGGREGEFNLTTELIYKNIRPEIEITYPLQGETVSGNITIYGSARDDLSIEKVMVKIDDGDWVTAIPEREDWSNWSYSLDTTTLQNGEHIIHAIANDGYLNSTEDSISIYVYNNHPPELSDGTVSPTFGGEEETFTFTVVYKDIDNNAPAFVHLIINEVEYSMSKDFSASPHLKDDDYTNGERYKYSMNLKAGTYSYYFTCSDGEFNESTQKIIDEPKVNHPPVLSDAKVSPEKGLKTTTFYFTVVYEDKDDHAPEYVKLFLDGKEREMVRDENSSPSLKDSDYTNGEQFVYATQLGAGVHSFYFEASDGYDTGKTDTFEGAKVNSAPQLIDGVVEPPTGHQYKVYTFRVLYKDLDDDPPLYVKVYIDNSKTGINMTLNTQSSPYLHDGKYQNGEQYIYSTTLDEGSHSFYFEAYDGVEKNQTGKIDAPTVQEIILEANAGSDITVNVGDEVYFDAQNSTYPEEIIKYEWDFGDGNISNGAVTKHRYENAGVYTVTLTVYYSFGVNVTDTLEVTVELEEEKEKAVRKGSILYYLLVGIIILLIIVLIAIWYRRKRKPAFVPIQQ